jgi:transposase
MGTPAELDLPDDVEALKSLLLAQRVETRRLHAEIAERQAIKAADDLKIANLTSIINMLQRAQYGTRSEKLRIDPLNDEQYAFVFDELETGLSALSVGIEKRQGNPAARPSRPRKGFAPHLERVEVIIEPAVPAGCDALEKVRIGEDVSERLDVTPARFRVLVTRRPKYAYRLADGEDLIVQAPAAPHLVEGGLPTEALLAHVAVSKYADSLPLYRQEEIYARDKVELDRSLLAQWMGKLGVELAPLADRVLFHIKRGERLFADETRLPTLAPGSGKVKEAWLWAYARDDRPFGGSGPPMVAYRFDDSRAGAVAAEHLANYRGILQVDGYAGYNKLAGPEGANAGMMLAGCWAHARRKFYELHANGSSPFATRVVEIMAPLWAIEDEIRGQSASVRAEIRRQRSAPVVAELFGMLEKELPRLSGKSKLAEAIRYALHRRAVFGRFLEDGRIEIDSNIVERAIRPQAILRKNALFAGSDGGGRTWATIATLLMTARLNNVDPFAWLTQTLERLAAGWPDSRIDELMPWAYQAD